ncbi:hypothetical protein Vafri_3197 [Volvox africanus]|uniref:Uncharacterized protein n=1 Tax=Volvox africanus TaxID=51714 RepID=A0A8J4ATW1_9CHLO|nr:hypothetical protein Vafri_3197 [Volvox africanus]
MLGLESCAALEELYLSHNGITTLEGLAPLTRLKILDVSSNLLTTLETSALVTLTQLEDLWLNDNRIPAIDVALDRALDPVRHSLACIYLEGNPAVRGPARCPLRVIARDTGCLALTIIVAGRQPCCAKLCRLGNCGELTCIALRDLSEDHTCSFSRLDAWT